MLSLVLVAHGTPRASSPAPVHLADLVVPGEAGGFGKLYEATLHLNEVASFLASWKGRRKLVCLAMFAGQAAISNEFSRRLLGTREHPACAYDVQMHSECQDITLRCVFFNALALLMTVVRGGLLFGGPPCSLWIWLSTSNHKRLWANMWGDTNVSEENKYHQHKLSKWFIY